jgi:hypothetical protein
LIKEATSRAENQDDKETKVVEKVVAFVQKIGEENDNFIK